MSMKIDEHDTTCVVVHRDGKYLLMKRATPAQKGHWCFPGGHVDAGEGLQECAQRECREEVGEVLVQQKPFFTFVHDVGYLHRHRCHTFFGEMKGEPKKSKEASDVGFFTIEQVAKMRLTFFTMQILNYMAEKRIIK